MLIVALVLAVIGLAALVTAVVTSNEVVAWVCIAASAVGVLLLIVDAVRERKTRRFEAMTGEAEESDPPFIADAENTEIIEATESTQVIEAAAVTDVLSDADDEVIADVEMTADVEMNTAEDHPEELVHDEPVKPNRGRQQGVEMVDRQTRHHTRAQGLHVVAIGLAFERRAFAKPSPARHASEGQTVAFVSVDVHFEQAVDHAKPIRGRTPDAADHVANQGIADDELRQSLRPLWQIEQTQPRNILEFSGGRCTAALVQGQVLGHGDKR